MRPGLEEWFKQETADLYDKRKPYAIRLLRLQRLIQAQEGVVRIQSNGSIATPIDPDDTKDAIEYLELLEKLMLPL